MRLTVRTMLAYLDGILEPTDAQEIGKRIDESEFATNLMHRVRDVTRRLRLTAPKVDGRGIGQDPNTVAEYLDNVLPGERVPDFEKVCLESDVHLAEVAACHQILALVLGEPAEIPPTARRRMYALTDKPAAPFGPEGGEGQAAAPTSKRVDLGKEAQKQKRRETRPKRAPIPEYLREPATDRKSRPVLTMVVLLLLGAVALVLGVGPKNFWNRITGNTQIAENDANADASANGEGTTKGGPTDETTGTVADSSAEDGTIEGTAGDQQGAAEDSGKDSHDANGGTEDSGAVNNRDEKGMHEEGTDRKGTDRNATDQKDIDHKGAPAERDSADESGRESPDESSAKLTGDQSSKGTSSKKTDLAPNQGLENIPGLNVPAEFSKDSSAEGLTGDEAAPAVSDDDAAPVVPDMDESASLSEEKEGANAPSDDDKQESAPPPEDVPGESVGRLVSEQQVLLRWVEADKHWTRISSKENIFSNDLLVALPGFRPVVSLGAGITLEILGGTEIEFGRSEEGLLGIRLLHGRVVMMLVGNENVKVAIEAGDKQGVLSLTDVDTALALDVHTPWVDGTDPESGEPPRLVDLLVSAGEAQWQELVDGKLAAADVVAGPNHVALDGRKLIPAQDAGKKIELPGWITKSEMSQIQKRGVAAIESNVVAGRSTTISLRELANDDRAEYRAEALRALSAIGEFDMFISAFNDSSHSNQHQRIVWNAAIDSLRSALTVGPENAARIRKVFERQRGESGVILYRLLWGFSDEQLKQGSATQLVRDLEHEDLDRRVLAFWNLQQVTGAAHYYEPSSPPVRRQRAIQQWKQFLQDGQVSRKQAVAPGKKASQPAKEEASAPIAP